MRNRKRRLLAAAAIASAAVLATPAAHATPTPHAPAVTDETPRTVAPHSAGRAADSPSTLAANRLDITMQAQEKSNWCWAAGGNTIAAFLGENYSQNQFCNAAFNRQQGGDCPNDQATLGNVQTALRWMGVNQGSYVNGWLRYPTVQGEVNAGRPVETRIQWSNGGGHMHVLYGYDDANSWVYWGDPWPSSDRYNWASHDWYVNNNTFSWTHSLYRIGA